jgi:uncharacterized membrane-anchored protein YhcB (DUF1043 family)
MLGSIKAKVIGIAVLIVVVIVGTLMVAIKIRDSKIEKLENQLEAAKSEISNYKIKEKANVAADKSKEAIETAMAGSKDRANITHVPDNDVLMHLQSDPF